MSRRLLLTLLIVVIALQLLRTLPVRSEPAQPAGRPSRDLLQQDGTPWLAELPDAAAQSLGIALPSTSDAAPALADVNDWSRIVFQSARGNNYNIFTMLGPGTPEHVAMVTGEYELYPRYNRGATSITYSSNRAGNYDIFSMPPDASTQTQLTSSTATDTDPSWSPDGSKIVFTSYRGGAAQVYVMNADGSNQHALTTDPNYYGGQASWSPDGSKIAYVSTSGGTNGRVWLMNADGSGKHVLSGQNYGQHPVWSPDGSKIAYDTDGDNDGWQEIWLMTADGGDQHQVYKSIIYGTLTDSWPRSWSPDSVYLTFTTIAYINYQGQWYWMWAHCNAVNLGQYYDGVIRVTSGEQDFYADWQTADIWAPTSHVNALPAQSPGPFTVTWGGTDSGPAGLWVYDVQFKPGANGSWVNWQMGTEETSASFPGEGGVVYYFRSRSRDHVGNLEPWPADAQASTTVESLPPVMTINPLPAYSHIDVLVTWSGYDPGGSGIKYYVLQWREEGGSWQGYPSDDYRALFQADIGKTYHFRVRGVDNANNEGEWTKDEAWTATTLYMSVVTGSVYDTRHVPISDTIVASWPLPVAPVSTTVNGRYVDYLKYGVPTTAFTVTHPGYQTPPSILAPEYEGLIVDHVLAPLDDVMQDGSFESGSPLPAPWISSVNFAPVVTETVKHSGDNAALLGCAEFGPPALLSTPTRVAGNAHAVAVQGGLHLIWREQVSTSNSEIFYAHRDANGVWSAPENISHDNLLSDYPDMAVDDLGAVHVVWQDTYGVVYYTRRAPGSSWSVPQGISSAPAWEGAQITTGQGGVVHVLWPGQYNMGLYYRRRQADGQWAAQITVHNDRAPWPRMATDAGGAVHVVWAPWGTGYGDLAYRRIRPDGSMDNPFNLSTGDTMQRERNPAVVVDQAGTVHVVWVSAREFGIYLIYRQRTSNGVWSAPVTMSTGSDTEWPELAVDGQGVLHLFHSLLYRQLVNGVWSAPESPDMPELMAVQGPSLQQAAQNPVMTVGQDGSVHITGRGTLTYSNIAYRRRTPSGAWLPWQTLLTDKPFQDAAQVAVDPSGLVNLVWESGDGTNNIISYAGPAKADKTAASSLAQTVTVPLTMTNPTLSFLYQVNGQGAAAAGPFSVTVGANNATTTVYSTTARSNAWVLGWTDLSAWAGQVVTVTFSVQETAAHICTWAALDDVSLGSWLTPVPQAVTPYQFDTWAPQVITITGQNFIGPAPQVRLGSIVLTDTQWISSTMITASVPGLGVGVYDLVVTNPGGQASGLPRAVTTGKRIYLPMIVSGR